MSIAVEHTAIKAPSTYQDWLVCFDMMKNGSGADTEVFDAACMGSFVRSDLENSVKEQMSGFWEDTIKFLYEQSLEFSNSELEDVLFLVKRIRLF